MTKARAALVAFMLCLAAVARADLSRSFPAHSGARYAFRSPLGSAAVTISIVESSASRVVIEVYFARPGLLASAMWQQFVLDVSSGKPVVREGYLLTAEGHAPERIPASALAGLDNASLSDFLISSRADLDRWKQGVERVVVPASGPGGIEATRYEQRTGTQVVTYWLSDDARPLGLVKLVSRGDKPSQTYELALEAVLTNVGARIDRKKAIDLTPEGRALLQTR